MLRINSLIGFGRRSAPITITAGSSLVKAGGTSVSFTAGDGVSWGAYAAGRAVWVGISGEAGATGQTLSSATIGGETASILEQVTFGSSNSGIAAIIAAFLPPSVGTSGTIALTFSGNFGNGVSIWWDTLYNVKSLTPTFNNTDGGNLVASASVASVTVSPGGVVLAAGDANNNDGVGTFTWSGLTEQYDTDYGGGRGTAARARAADFTPGTVTLTPTVSGRVSLAVASIR